MGHEPHSSDSRNSFNLTNWTNHRQVYTGAASTASAGQLRLETEGRIFIQLRQLGEGVSSAASSCLMPHGFASSFYYFDYTHWVRRKLRERAFLAIKSLVLANRICTRARSTRLAIGYNPRVKIEVEIFFWESYELKRLLFSSLRFISSYKFLKLYVGCMRKWSGAMKIGASEIGF